MSVTNATTFNPNLTTQQEPSAASNQNGALGMSWGEIARKVGAVFLFTLAIALTFYAPIAVGLYIGAAALLCSKVVVGGLMIAIPLTLVGIGASIFGGVKLWNKKENVVLYNIPQGEARPAVPRATS